MSALLEIAPAQFGLPEKFVEFREAQAEAIEFALSSSKQFIAACAPTGIGKSLLGWTVARALGGRAVYLTATKALQEQILADFAACGVVDVRGKSNYPCRVYTKKWGSRGNCEEGHELGCKLGLSKAPDCPYQAAVLQAEQSELIVTNYSYWLHSRRQNRSALESPLAGPIDLLICDEAHSAPEEIASFLRIDLPQSEYEKQIDYALGDSDKMTAPSGQKWRNWAERRAIDVEMELVEESRKYSSVREARTESPIYRKLEFLRGQLGQISQISENWVWEIQRDGVAFECVWPGEESHYLWSGVPKVLLLSATLRPYTLKLLGIPKAEYEYQEFSNGWPKQNALVYYLPTVKLNYRSTDADYTQMVRVMDDIIADRLDRKGVIHSVSYSRMRTLLEKSRFNSHMIFNEKSADSLNTAKRFRQAKAPAILVSPSFTTGWDFAYDQCEYQIIPKVPFAFADNRVMKERNKEDTYRVYSAVLEMTQMIGRGRRAPDDRCETFILDKSFSMLLAVGKAYQPRDFVVHLRNDLPPKARKLVSLI